MITAGQIRASRALLGIDQRALAEAAGLSLPTIQRMEASDGVVRGNVDSLMKLIAALECARHRAHDRQWRQLRRWPRRTAQEAGNVMLTIALAGAALELALGVCAVIIVKSAAASRIIYGAIIDRHDPVACGGADASAQRRSRRKPDAAGRPALARRTFPPRRALRFLPRRGRSRCRERKPVRARLWPP